MSRVHPTLCCYRSNSDLAELKEWFSGSPEARRRAVSRTKALQSRGRLPHAVDATALLISVQLSELQDTFVLRSAYSMALVRFVNGLLDPFQLGAFAMLLLSLAKNIGLPACFVEVRHMATHEVLPSLALLREMAEKALEWLFERFWSTISRTSDNFDYTVDVLAPHLFLLESLVDSSLSSIAKGKKDPKYKSAVVTLKEVADNVQERHVLVRAVFGVLLQRSFKLQYKLFWPLLDTLGCAFQVELAIHFLQSCSRLSTHDYSDDEKLQIREWMTFLIQRVPESDFPLRLSHQKLLNVNDAIAALSSSLSLLDPGSTMHQAATAALNGEKYEPVAKKAFALPPSLDEILGLDGHSKKKQKLQTPSGSSIFETHLTWKVRPFGISN